MLLQLDYKITCCFRELSYCRTLLSLSIDDNYVCRIKQNTHYKQKMCGSVNPTVWHTQWINRFIVIGTGLLCLLLSLMLRCSAQNFNL